MQDKPTRIIAVLEEDMHLFNLLSDSWDDLRRAYVSCKLRGGNRDIRQVRPLYELCLSFKDRLRLLEKDLIRHIEQDRRERGEK